jgi:hypothetical protein
METLRLIFMAGACIAFVTALAFLISGQRPRQRPPKTIFPNPGKRQDRLDIAEMVRHFRDN